MTGDPSIQDTGEPRARLEIVGRVGARISVAAAAAHARCARIPSRPIEDLEDATRDYLEQLRARAALDEFLDLGTAVRVAQGCLALLRELRRSPAPAHHRAVQAAVEYFLLEDDGEDDGSIIGFDDDLEVVLVTAQVLGWPLPEGGA